MEKRKYLESTGVRTQGRPARSQSIQQVRSLRPLVDCVTLSLQSSPAACHVAPFRTKCLRPSTISLCSSLSRQTKFHTHTDQHTSFIIQPVLIPTFLDTNSKKKYSSFPFLLSCDIFFSSQVYCIQPHIQYVSRCFPQFCAAVIVSPRCHWDISTHRSVLNPPVTRITSL
jgi:hypothetical protein